MATQEQVRSMVEKHVLVNATTLIYNLYAADNYQDALFDLMGKDDFEDGVMVDIYDSFG